MPQCIYCSKYFSNTEKYDKHMKNRPAMCKKYENISFVCICNFRTNGLSIIKTHQKYCNIIKEKTPLSAIILKTIKRKLKHSIKNCKKIVKEPIKVLEPPKVTDKKQISNLFKTRYDLLSCKSFDTHLANLGLVYKAFTSYNSNVNIDQILEKIKLHINSIIDDENISIDALNSSFDNIKNERSKLLITLSGNEIQNLLNENYGNLLSFLFNYNKRLNKNNKERLANIVSKSLTGLEGRLTNNLHIKDQGVLFNLGEITDATKNIYFNEIKYMIENNPTSFYSTNFFSRIKNPLIAVLQFSKYIETFILTNYCIIYCEHENINYNDNDPYSIYTLNKIEDNKKYWHMDTRAENLALDIIDSLKSYCIDIFSRFWKFNEDSLLNDDAVYIEIAKTVFLLCDPVKLSNKLRFIIKSKKNYVKTNNDIFNMKCDDLPQKQKFENNVIEEESLKVAVTEMFSFDDLQKYNIDDFIKTINKI